MPTEPPAMCGSATLAMVLSRVLHDGRQHDGDRNHRHYGGAAPGGPARGMDLPTYVTIQPKKDWRQAGVCHSTCASSLRSRRSSPSISAGSKLENSDFSWARRSGQIQPHESQRPWASAAGTAGGGRFRPLAGSHSPGAPASATRVLLVRDEFMNTLSSGWLQRKRCSLA